jgi:hypothetical protein
MPSDDIGALIGALTSALDGFDWKAAEVIVCDQLIPLFKSKAKQLDEQDEQSVKDILHKLRRKRRFRLMAQFADALLESGASIPQLRRQYAQALIELNTLGAGELVLQEIVNDRKSLPGEVMEARGLVGRIYKQRYVNNNDPNSPANRANLLRALEEYYQVYRRKADKTWHGINVVALTARARRDGFPAEGLPDEKKLARKVLKTLAMRRAESIEELPAWDIATAIGLRRARRVRHGLGGGLPLPVQPRLRRLRAGQYPPAARRGMAAQRAGVAREPPAARLQGRLHAQGGREPLRDGPGEDRRGGGGRPEGGPDAPEQRGRLREVFHPRRDGDAPVVPGRAGDV